MDFTIPTDHKMKIKESEKLDKYLLLAVTLKTMILIIVVALGTVPKGYIIKLIISNY